ncbi:4-hydroxy-3-methylbut-2-enyl diphosphate reductase [candidate division KSB1 bacterium 4484_87]|nr:MAG: 4-hydroxy-3-methylbut-2-enyl diphosphate reductase [candidate division KSB1 bacterium 4484_87]
MEIRIDQYAGFCPGVRKAIEMLETEIETGVSVVALGELIHNEREIDRLKNLGLHTVDQEAFQAGQVDSSEISDRKLFIRAHGISPQLRQKIERSKIAHVDGTCWLVKRSQEIVKDYYQQGYQIVIVGKKKHPEVQGLLGFCNNEGVVVYQPGDEENLEFSDRVLLVAQTTIDLSRFDYFQKKIEKGVGNLVVKNTICPVVTNRQRHIIEFAESNDVVVFVADPHSSNSQVLFKLCKEKNPRSYFVTTTDELKKDWFKGAKTVGLTGGASTPVWQLEEFKQQITKTLTH